MHKQEPEYIGFWIRVAAAFIDTVAVSVPLLLIILPLLFFLFPDVLPANNIKTLLVNYSIISIGLPFIAIILFWIYKSATPGKIIFDAIIVDADTYGAPSKRQLLIRYLGYYVSIFPFCLGLFWVGWDKRKQGFHDKLASTIVIRKSTQPSQKLSSQQ